MTQSAAEERLAALATGWSASGDLRAVFAECYRVMTARLSEGVAAGDFADGEWVARLRDRFADYYFEALDAYGPPPGATPCPQTWRVAFDACARPGCHPLEALLLGINAHINHDLALALADVLDDWDVLTPEQRVARRVDHEHVNDVIRATTDEVQRDVVATWSPAANRLDSALGRVDEWAFGTLVEHWRTRVWDDAMALVAVAPDARSDVVSRLDDDARRLARIIAMLPG